MIKKGSKLYSILKFKCPHCHEGEFFKAHPYNLAKAGDIYQKCLVCEKSNSKEPGFYYGSMFVSYALGVALFLVVYGLTYLFLPEATVTLYISLIILFLLTLGPLIYALSKIIWANMFYSYNEKPVQNKGIKNA